MSQAFVYDEIEITAISEWMRELVTEQIIFPYKAGSTNQRLGWIINFKNHQVINRPQPSKLPPPSIQNSEFKNAIYARDKQKCHLCGEPIIITDDYSTVGSKAPSLDHLQPVSLSGSDYPSNLKLAHISCNKSRRNKPLPNDEMNDSLNDSLLEGKGKGKGKGREGKGEEGDAPAIFSDEEKRQKRVSDSCLALRNAGVLDFSSIHPTFTKLIDLGVTAEEFEDCAKTAKFKKFSYIVQVIAGRREDANNLVLAAKSKTEHDWKRGML